MYYKCNQFGKGRQKYKGKEKEVKKEKDKEKQSARKLRTYVSFPYSSYTFGFITFNSTCKLKSVHI